MPQLCPWCPRPALRGTRASHHARPRFDKPTAVHVTVRMRWNVWNLRSRRCHSRISGCLEEALGRFGLRVIEYSVLGNHIHLIVEADDAASLARGMHGLAIRIAKSLNATMLHAVAKNAIDQKSRTGEPCIQVHGASVWPRF